MCLSSAEKGGDGEREAHFVEYWKYERFEMGNYWLAVVFRTGFLVISGIVLGQSPFIHLTALLCTLYAFRLKNLFSDIPRSYGLRGLVFASHKALVETTRHSRTH